MIYRPPPNASNGFTFTQFIDEFIDLLTYINATHPNSLIVGDFNIHVDNPNSKEGIRFNEILQEYGFIQHVSFPTHSKGHTLDLVITPKDSLLIRAVDYTDPGISDHHAILFRIFDEKPAPITKTIKYKDVKNIDSLSFQRDIKAVSDQIASSNDPVELVSQYGSKLSALAQEHIPVIEKTVIIRPNTKWFNLNLRNQKVLKRRLERKFKRTGLPSDYEAFKAQCKHYNYLITEAKSEFISQQVVESSDDKKKLFSLAKTLVHGKQEHRYSSQQTNLADSFCDFFIDKIVKIRQDIDNNISDSDSIDTLRDEINLVTASTRLENFEPATEEEIRKVVLSMSNATCELDPLPTNLLRDSIDEILPSLTKIVNSSLTNAEVPSELKRAVVRPLLKKASLDPESFKNFRPVSNLSFISKLCEKVVSIRLETYLEQNNLCPPMQSAYRKFHSTETALIKIQNDLLCNLDNKKMSALVLLDLSAAFDTIDHGILLSRLKSRYGIHGNALSWFESYLNGRSQFININGFASKVTPLPFGVPQGSILGPFLFTLYTSPMSDIAKYHRIDHHFYADDAQLYVTLENTNQHRLNACIKDMRNWMKRNKLKVNDTKTEVLLIGSAFSLRSTSSISVIVGDQSILSSEFVVNLGSIFDQKLSMSKFVARKVSESMYHLKTIGKIRRYLTKESAQILVQAMVLSRLDYCNSLLVGISKDLLRRLNTIQRYAARVICNAHYTQSATPLMVQLHWLPVEFRIKFKVLVNVFKCLHEEAPTYLSDLISLRKTNRSLRSSSGIVLTQTRTRTNFGKRAFCQSGPELWNSLPESLRCVSSLLKFRKLLKTYLFKTAYKL